MNELLGLFTSAAFPNLILVPLLASPIIYLAGRLVVINSKRTKIGGPVWLVRVLALLAILVTWSFYVPSLQAFLAGHSQVFGVQAIWMRVDGISLLLTGTALTLGTAVVLYSGPYMAGEVGEEKYYAMLLAMIGIIIGMGAAGDLFNLWVWFEAMAVSSYLLVIFYREEPASLEAGMKYIVQSAAGSVLVLIGIALVLSTTGVLDISVLQATVAGAAHFRPVLAAAGALFVIGFGVKVAIVPLHTWLPDAHSQAPSGISAMLSGIVIEAGLIAMLRALSVTGMSVTWGVVLMVFGAVNILYGNLLALRQTKVKRLLAFSSLSHIGYMLLGLGIALQSGLALGAQGAFFHLFNHMLMKGLAFLAVGALMYALFLTSGVQGSHKALDISDLAGAAKSYPLAALALSIAVLGLGGLPPLAGFMSKWQIFVAGFDTKNIWIMALVVFAALNSVLSLAYYAPLVNVMYREKPSALMQTGKRLPFVMQLSLAILLTLVVVLGFMPGLMNWLTVPASHIFITMFKP
jgi:proton-translocating NADH-quinone oxidoreductase chain N